jgi:hypothetical protein
MSANSVEKRVIGRPFQKGNPGKQKGTTSKFTSLKQSFLEAFEKTGGTAGLAAWINSSPRNRAVFYQLITKLFPQEVQHSGEVAATLKFSFGDNGNGNGNGEAHE